MGNPKEKPKFKLGQMDLDVTHKYKYLGEMINDKMNLKDQITQTESKVEAAYQAITAIAGDRHYKNIQMSTVWKLVCSCLTPIITYAGETRNPSKAENKKFNQILDNILKRILMVPTSTPREALYIETGLLDVETLNDKNRIVMSERLHKNGNKTLDEITNNPAPGAWKEQVQKTREKYNLTEETLREGDTTPSDFIKRKIHEAFREKIENEGKNKSKILYLLEGNQEWNPGQPKPYMLQLGRKEASTIFKALTRMLQVKNNYKNAHKNLTCRACQRSIETQEHVLAVCPAIHTNLKDIVLTLEIFSEDTKELQETSMKIIKIMDKLENSVV